MEKGTAEEGKKSNTDFLFGKYLVMWIEWDKVKKLDITIIE